MGVLDARAFGSNNDEFHENFAKAITQLEASKTLPSDIVKLIEKEDKIKIVA